MPLIWRNQLYFQILVFGYGSQVWFEVLDKIDFTNQGLAVTVGKWLYIDSGEYYQLNGKDSFIQTPSMRFSIFDSISKLSQRY